MLDKLFYKEFLFKYDSNYRWMYAGILEAVFNYHRPASNFNYWPLEYCMDSKIGE